MFGTRLLLPLRRYRISYLENFPHLVPTSADVVSRRKLFAAAVIDNEHFSPLSNLRQQNFDIVHIGNPNSPTEASGYEIIVCDIRGVATEFSPNLQGGGLMQAIRTLYPEKYIIAYSGSFSRTGSVTAAKSVCNARVSKGASLSDWTDELDMAIDWLSKPDAIFLQVRSTLQKRGLTEKHIRLAEDAYVRSLLQRKPAKLVETSSRDHVPADIRAVLQGLASSAIWTLITGSPA